MIKKIWDGTCPVCGGRMSLEDPNTDEHMCDTCDYWYDVDGEHYPEDAENVE